MALQSTKACCCAPPKFLCENNTASTQQLPSVLEQREIICQLNIILINSIVVSVASVECIVLSESQLGHKRGGSPTTLTSVHLDR